MLSQLQSSQKSKDEDKTSVAIQAEVIAEEQLTQKMVAQTIFLDWIIIVMLALIIIVSIIALCCYCCCKKD